MRPTLLLFFMRRTGGAVLLVWTALAALLVFFEMLRSADDHAIATALLLAVAVAPRLAMEALPFACAIGGVLAMRRMVAEGEMPALRTAGLAPRVILLFLCAAALPFAALYAVLSEVLLPNGAEVARAVRGDGGGTQGLWLAEGEDYIRIAELDSRGMMRAVVVYHMQGEELRSITRAARATYSGGAGADGGGWVLHEVRRTTREDGRLVEERAARLPWGLSLQPASLSAFTRQPREMALRDAMAAAQELAAAGQHNHTLQKTIWQRWLTLPALFLLAAFAVGFIGGDRRGRYAVSVPVFAAVLAAGGYFIARDFAIQSAGVSASELPLLLPPLVLAAVVVQAVRRGQ